MDDLTGAYLRGAGLLQLDREVMRAQRMGKPLTVAFLDVDHLKSVNDTDGVRVTTDDGWWLLRASNTQDVLVARAESDTRQGLDRLLAQIDDQLEASGLERGPQAGH